MANAARARVYHGAQNAFPDSPLAAPGFRSGESNDTCENPAPRDIHSNRFRQAVASFQTMNVTDRSTAQRRVAAPRNAHLKAQMRN